MSEHENESPENESGGNAEAAKRRRQLREAEGQRDALQARVDQYERSEVERLAGDLLEDPSDLFLTSSLDVMRDEEGRIDQDLVRAEITSLTEQKPHYRKAPDRPDMHQGARADASPDEGPSFGEALRNTLRGGR